jgi:hypothetical protein
VESKVATSRLILGFRCGESGLHLVTAISLVFPCAGGHGDNGDSRCSFAVVVARRSHGFLYMEIPKITHVRARLVQGGAHCARRRGLNVGGASPDGAAPFAADNRHTLVTELSESGAGDEVPGARLTAAAQPGGLASHGPACHYAPTRAGAGAPCTWARPVADSAQ